MFRIKSTIFSPKGTVLLSLLRGTSSMNGRGSIASHLSADPVNFLFYGRGRGKKIKLVKIVEPPLSAFIFPSKQISLIFGFRRCFFFSGSRSKAAAVWVDLNKVSTTTIRCVVCYIYIVYTFFVFENGLLTWSEAIEEEEGMAILNCTELWTDVTCEQEPVYIFIFLYC